jgi:hypothetical protein
VSLFKQRCVPFLLLLFPPWLDASENLSGLLNVTIGPKPDLDGPDFHYRWSLNCSGRDKPLNARERAAYLFGSLPR